MKQSGNKYQVAPRSARTADGIVYHSKAEMLMAQRLTVEKECGAIHCFARQVKVQLGPDFKTIVDFMVNEGFKDQYAVEVKGVETPTFKTVKRLWQKYVPCPMHIVKRGKTAKVIEGAATMSRSKAYIAISLTREQTSYLRELVAHDLTIGDELPEDDDTFADKDAMAESVLEAIDSPMPVYVAEKSNA